MIAHARRQASHERDVLTPGELDDVWERYLGYLVLIGFAGPKHLDQLRRLLRPLRAAVIRAHLENGVADSWRFQSLHEAAAFGLEAYFQPLPAEAACEWPPGAWGKIAAMADRLDAGQELHHPADAE